MLIRNEQTLVGELCPETALKIQGQNIIDESIFFDLEHYLYKKPIAIGVFGAAVFEEEENALLSTQYMIENKKDAKAILEMIKEYFIQKKKEGKNYIVTFSGNNDFFVINHLFEKYHLDYIFKDEFTHVDLQREYEVRFKKNIGLKNLEKLYSIERKGELMSGMTIAKTFSKVISDKDYIERMPKEKIRKILRYNEQDVVNLFRIMNRWEKVQIEDVLELEEQLLLEKNEKMERRKILEGNNIEESKLERNKIEESKIMEMGKRAIE